MGLVTGVAVTLVLGEGLLGEPESDTVANAALEGAPAERFDERPAQPAEPVAVAALQKPEPAQVAQQPTAAEAAVPAQPAFAPTAAPTPVPEPAPSAPPPVAAAPSAPAHPAPAHVEPAVAPKTTTTVVSALKPPPPVLQPQAAPMLDKAALAARAPLPGVPQPPPINPTAPKAPPVVYQDPNSEDAKLAAAAQVRLKGDTKIDNMLDQALTGEKQAPPTAAAPQPAALAQTPSRDDVVSSMSVLVPAIRGCAQGQSGLAPMSIVVLSDGRVESAALSSGPFQGTASGRCMEGVVRRARFPRFKQANFRVQFPFAVQ